MNAQDWCALVALKMTSHLGNIKIKKLIEAVSSPSQVFNLPKSGLLKIQGIGELTASEIQSKKWLSAAETELELAEKYGITLTSLFCENYPKRLKHIYDAPVLLYSKGNFNWNSEKVIGIVGTRKPTNYGKSVLKEIISYLNSIPNILVVSGLAYGIDIETHRACLENNITNIAVLGSGINKVYPSLHIGLANSLQKNGGLISEKRIEQSPEAKNFPERNRIIAGLCDAIIVVEAAEKSGSLITARLATEMNREVMAVPGRWLDKISQGCNQIIHEDIAHLISSPEDIENITGWNIERKKQAPKKIDKPMRPLSNKEQKVVDFLKKQPEAHIDAISQATEIPISELSSVLLQLAIDDCIQNTNNIYSLA